MMSKMKGMCTLHKAAMVLMWVGALNWGLVGALKVNLVNMLLGGMPVVERIVYVLVGASALMMLGWGKCCMKDCKCMDGKCDHCGPMDKPPMAGGPPKA